MASFCFFKFPHTFDILLLSSLILVFSELLKSVVRLLTLIDQARNRDFAVNLLDNMKNASDRDDVTLFRRLIYDTKLKAIVTILKNNLWSVFPRRIFLFCVQVRCS